MTRLLLDLSVNGQRYDVDVEPGAYLLDVLRDRIGLLGTKEACDEGECGACTVLLDGRAVDSCIAFAGQAAGCEIRTVEGLGRGRELDGLQRAFVQHGAVQCGFCTPGFLMAATELLQENPRPTQAEIRDALAGNLCRCTGYNNIVRAVAAAADELTAEGD
jgi:carbon-monoxide dehydrogenase small subunit